MNRFSENFKKVNFEPKNASKMRSEKAPKLKSNTKWSKKQWTDHKKFVLQKDGRARRWIDKTEFKGPSGRSWTSKITNKKFNDWDLQQKTTKTENWRVKSPI